MPHLRRAARAAAKRDRASGPDSPVAVLDIGASAVRLVVAEVHSGSPPRILEEASRGVQLGKDTFARGSLGPDTIRATLKALEGFRTIMDSYGVGRYRAVATSAVREAQNRDTFVDRVRLRTGIDLEVIDGPEENRLTYLAVSERLRGHEALTTGSTLLVEVGGGSGDISLLRKGEPTLSGTYALGSIRVLQGVASWRGGHDQRTRLLRRHIHNVVGDIRREMALGSARHLIALGGDIRFAARQLLEDDLAAQPVRSLPRQRFVSFCDAIVKNDVDQLVESYNLHQAEAETLVPALLAYRELLLATAAKRIVVPDATLRLGLLLDLAGSEEGLGIEVFRKQVLASAAAFGEKYRYDATHARHVAHLAMRLFDELRRDHGLGDRARLLLEVAATLHDVGIFVNQRAHHKHSAYILQASEIFGLSREDLAIVSNVARYHRRAVPQKSHLAYSALDSEDRVRVNKLAGILRLANALDADHEQHIRDLRVVSEGDGWVLEVEASGDITMERLAALARSDLLTEVFGHKLSLREKVPV
jgi:exopolyphosphatase/guanosine-5'-triphosphate,3'-diphosphate pyrophosphatase